jgi:hypothetical protein
MLKGEPHAIKEALLGVFDAGTTSQLQRDQCFEFVDRDLSTLDELKGRGGRCRIDIIAPLAEHCVEYLAIDPLLREPAADWTARRLGQHPAPVDDQTLKTVGFIRHSCSS